MSLIQMLFEALMISSACSTDILVTGFAYGTNKIKISFISALFVNLICSTVLGLSLFFGSFIGKYVPQTVTLIVCVVILCIIGVSKILNCWIKNLIRKNSGISKDIKFSLFSLKFILNISANPEAADIDNSKALSLKEAVPLAIALSLDGLAIGLGTGLVSHGVLSYLIITLFSFAMGIVFLLFGRFVGNKIVKKTTLNLSWISGVLLIALALMKIWRH